MKLNIKWKSLLQQFDSIATIETYDENRFDIINLLQTIDKNGFDIDAISNLFGGGEIYKQITNRVIRYLEDCNYIINGTLTNEGKNILKTKLVPTKEKGKYRFLTVDSVGPMKDIYGSGDKLIIDYKREKDTKQRHREKDDNNNYKNNIVINSADKEKFKIIKLGENNNFSTDFTCIKYNNSNNEASLKFTLDGHMNRFKLTISGRNLGNKNMSNQLLFDEIANFQTNNYIIDILSQNIDYLSWDDENKMFKMNNIDQLLKSKEISPIDLVNFKTNISKLVEIEGNKCRIEANEIPIMPYNEKEVSLWLKVCIDSLAEAKYMTEKEFDLEVSNLFENPGLKVFKDFEISVNDYISDIKESNKRAYWNLRAPIDLKPIYEQTGVIDLNITFGKKESIYNIFKTLVGEKDVDEFVFLSKYINTKQQIKKCNILLDTFREFGADKLTIVSNNRNLNIDANILQYEDVFGNKKNWPHDRYFAFKSNNKWNYYKMSAELDQCVFDENIDKWDKDLIGKWKDISFYKITEDVFPKDIIDKLEKQLVEC